LRAAGRPWPKLSDDPVIDYMIMEAVLIKVQQEDIKLRKEAERDAAKKQWQSNVDDLKNELGQQ